MVRSLIAALGIGLAPFCVAATLTAASPSEPMMFPMESREASCYLELPLDWETKVAVGDLACVAFAPKTPMAKDDFLDNIALRSVSDKDGKGPKELAAVFVANMKARTEDFALLSEGEAKLSGREAFRVEYSYSLGGRKVLSRVVFLPVGPNMAVLSFNAEPKRFIAKKSLFDKVEASFRPL